MYQVEGSEKQCQMLLIGQAGEDWHAIIAS